MADATDVPLCDPKPDVEEPIELVRRRPQGVFMPRTNPP